MPTDREEIELAFNVELETRKLTGEIAKVNREIKRMAARKPKLEAFDRKSVNKFKVALGQSDRQMKALHKSLGGKVLTKEFAAVNKAHRVAAKVARREAVRLNDLQKKLDSDLLEVRKKGAVDLAKATTKAEKDAIADRIKADTAALNVKHKNEVRVAAKTVNATMRKSHATLRKGVAGRGGEVAAAAASAKALREVLSHKTGMELGEGVKDVLSSISAKDLPGLGKAGVKISTDLLKGLGKKTVLGGGAMEKHGARMGGTYGKALEKVGGAMKGLGPMIGGIAKMGPVISMVSSLLVGLVKVMLDADAAVKDMNKDILEGSPTWDMYSRGVGGVEFGMERLEDSLTEARKQVTNFKMNWEMGTLAKDHLQVLSSLQKEGITWKSIGDRVKENKSSTDSLNQSMSKYSDISSMAIGYSRLFGVSIDEIAQAQADMMRDMGISLTETKMEFYRMGRAATESGIASNKFFAILRGVSTDLSLYGVRLGEVTKMLGQLGKVMSPRTAQKYLEAFAQGMKGVSVEDRLKKTLMIGGDKTANMVAKDLKEQKEDLLQKIATEAGVGKDEAETLLKGGRSKSGKTLTEYGRMGKVQDVGTKREAYRNLTRGQAQVGKGPFGTAMAAKNLSGYGAMQMNEQAVLGMAKKMGFGGGVKTLEDLFRKFPMQAQKAAEASGMGDEQIDAILGMRAAVDQQREDLVNAIENPSPTEEDTKLLAQAKEAGVLTDEQIKHHDKAAVEALSSEKVWKALDVKNNEANKSDADKMLDEAKKQGKLTTSVVDRLALIWDVLNNWIYEAVADIYDALPFKGKKGEMKTDVYKTQDSMVMKAWKDSAEDATKFLGNLASSDAAKGINDLLMTSGKKTEELKKQEEQYEKDYQAEQDAGRKAELKAKLDAVAAERAATEKSVSRTMGDIEGSFKAEWEIAKMSSDTDAKGDIIDRLSKAGGAVGLKEGQIKSIAEGMGRSGNLADAVKGANLSSDEAAKFYAKAGLWFTSAKGRMDLIAGYNKTHGREGTDLQAGAARAMAEGAPGEPTATGQAAATQKSVAPGTGGAGAAVQAQTAAAAPPGTPPMTAAAPATGGEGGYKMPTLPDEHKMNQEMLDMVDFTGGATVNSLQDLWKALRMKGIKLDKVQLEGEYKEVIRKGSLEAIREALFEYALYTGSSTLEKMKSSGVDAVADMADKFEEDQKRKASIETTVGNFIAPKAEGGLVTGIAGGQAVFAPPGEGLTSIGPGERIVPAGGGAGGGAAGGIHLHVNGLGGADLANYLRDKVAQGVYEYKRREKFQ